MHEELTPLDEMKLKMLRQQYGDMSYDELLAILFDGIETLDVTPREDPAFDYLYKTNSDMRKYITLVNLEKKLGRHEHLYYIRCYVDYNNRDTAEVWVLNTIPIIGSQGSQEMTEIKTAIYKKYAHKEPGRSHLLEIKEMLIEEYRPAHPDDLKA